MIFQYFLLLFCVFNVYCQNPEVEIPQGRLRGDMRTNIDVGSYYSFKNIPYAKPPVGELRFRDPVPADGWEGTRDAVEELPWCVQLGNTHGQEDCLYLNVYTPGLPNENITNLPVMAWIHGGGFTGLSGAESTFGGQFLLTKDIIFVTLNYRLGVFGFISLDDPNLGVTGNAAMKDQVLALKWVQDSIEYFGGDPNNVLVFGESGGSMSIHYHLVSPMSKGLFHKAITQSGDATTGFLDPVTRNTGVAVAEVLGIQTENWEDMLRSLQEVSAGDLAMAELSFNSELAVALFSAPIVEIPSNGTTFLDRRPIDVIRSGDYNEVPFIIGITDAEGLTFQFYSRMFFFENMLIEDFTQFVPDEFNVESGSILEELIALLVKNFYYGDTEPSRDDFTQAVHLTTDFAFAYPSYRTVREYLRTTASPIYFYYFTAITELGYLRQQDETVAAFPGAAHADDLGHLFYMDWLPVIVPGSVEERVMRSLVDLWTNFAIYGNPTPDGISDFTWEPVEEDQFNYLEIATEETFPILNSLFTEDRIAFWDALYEEFTRKTN